MRMRQKTKIKLMKIVFVCSIDRRISVVVCCHVLLLAMSECGSSFFLFLSRWFELAELFTPKSFIRFIHIFKRDLLTFPAMAEAVERVSDEKIFSSLSIKNNSRSRVKKKEFCTNFKWSIHTDLPQHLTVASSRESVSTTTASSLLFNLITSLELLKFYSIFFTIAQ